MWVDIATTIAPVLLGGAGLVGLGQLVVAWRTSRTTLMSVLAEDTRTLREELDQARRTARLAQEHTSELRAILREHQLTPPNWPG